MKKTLLEMVQNILSSMKSDEVNSIGDSVLAYDVAQEIESTYYILLEEHNSEYQRGLIQLTPSTDPTKPTHMKIPENAKELQWIKYNNLSTDDVGWEEVCYLDPEDFVQRSVQLANQDNVLEVEDFSGSPLYVKSNQQPKYYTTFDEEWLVFDGYNATLDTTLQSSKTMCWAITFPAFEFEDNFVPRLKADLFPRLIAEAKSACFINFKQTANSKEEQRSRRLATNYQSRQHRVREKQPTSRSVNDYSRP